MSNKIWASGMEDSLTETEILSKKLIAKQVDQAKFLSFMNNYLFCHPETLF